MGKLADKDYLIQRIWLDKTDTKEDIEAIIKAAPELDRFENLEPLEGFVRLTKCPNKKALAELIDYLKVYDKYHLLYSEGDKNDGMMCSQYK